MKVTLAQLDYIVGDFAYNYEKIKKTIKDCSNESDLIVFSELALSGYYVFDLVERPGFIHQQSYYLDLIVQLSQQVDCAIVLGAISENSSQGKAFFNSALVIYKGSIIHRYDKQLLPSYNIFNEPRHFERGYQKPYFKFKDYLIGLLICEDIWDQENQLYFEQPIKQLKDKNVDLVVTLNSSPSEFTKQAQRRNLLSQLALNLNAPCAYINQVGGYDEIVYDGASFLLSETGQLLTQLDVFKESVKTVKISQSINLQAELETQETDKDAFYLEQIKLGLCDYVRKCGFSGVVVALSGGIDSALTVAIATLALGSDKVKAITMPSQYSSVGSVKDSEQLCHNLSVELYNRAITQDYDLSCQLFETSFDRLPSRLTKENMQARIRGRVVMEYSNEFGLLAISCGNKSELSVGYATLYGDMNGGINIIGDLYKTDVYKLAEYINRTYGDLIPEAILRKDPSAELSEGQKDCDSLPSYDLLDAVLKLSIEGDLLDSDEVDQLKQLIAKMPTEEVKKVLSLIDKAEFKRKQAPPIIRIQKRSFGQGRLIPITHQFHTDHWQLAEYGDMMGDKTITTD